MRSWRFQYFLYIFQVYFTFYFIISFYSFLRNLFLKPLKREKNALGVFYDFALGGYTGNGDCGWDEWVRLLGVHLLTLRCKCWQRPLPALARWSRADWNSQLLKNRPGTLFPTVTFLSPVSFEYFTPLFSARIRHSKARRFNPKGGAS